GEPPKVSAGAPAPEAGSQPQQQQQQQQEQQQQQQHSEDQWRLQQQKEQEALQQKQAYEAQQMQEQQQLQMQQQQQMHYQQQQMQMQHQQQQMYMQQQQQQQQYGADQQGYNPQYGMQQQDPRYMQQQHMQQQQPPPMNPYQQPPHLAPPLPPGFQQAAAPVPPRGLRQVNEEEEVNDAQGGWGGGAPPGAAGGGGVIGYQEQPAELQEYSYQDLVDATEDFQEHSVLGEGGFGKVYKGYVLDRFPVEGGPPVTATVAIKKLNPSGYQSKVEWMREILVLGKLNHPNLVRLIGYCAELEEMLLVYEFVPRGSLDYHLWPAPNVPADPLPWQARLRIAHDAACGLAHLHASNFIHRDFKAPNILIAEVCLGVLLELLTGIESQCLRLHSCPVPLSPTCQLTVKNDVYACQLTVKSDVYAYGVVLLELLTGIETPTHATCLCLSAPLSDRYASTPAGQLTVKSDVYAYGVVLLELLTGKKAMGISPGGKPKTLTSWARPYLNKARPDLESLVDPNLIDPFPEKVARTLAISAKHCIQDDTNMRPMMSDIVDTLRPLNTAINGRR
ncbi:unnamed protein product, partial [Closterium sp. NIES-53]